MGQDKQAADKDRFLVRRFRFGDCVFYKPTRRDRYRPSSGRSAAMAQRFAMKNIQIVDRASNATLSIFQSTEQEFEIIFPAGRDMELIEDLIARVGDDEADRVLTPLWGRPILKRDAVGIHGTLFYGNEGRVIPLTKREVDWDESAINPAQRALFSSHGK